MNHSMSDVTSSHLGSAAQLFVANENVGGVPVMVEFWNAGVMPNKLDFNMSSSSGAAVDAMNSNVQFLMHNPSDSSNEVGETVARYKPRSVKKASKKT